MVTGICTDKGRNILLDRGFNASPTRTQISVFKVGTGTTTPTVSDTDLETPVPITGTEQVDDCEAADWVDSADMLTSLNTTTYKQGTNSLNLIKDGTSSINAETNKATTSLDFTDKELSIWIYIVDAAALAKLETLNCLTIIFGSDSSNYYTWTKDNADLTAGEWNLIDGLTVATADSTTGTPVLTTMDYTSVQLTATGTAIVWIAGDFMMDDIKLISADDYVKTFETDYPTMDYTANEVTIRTRLNTLNANGYMISEVGLFNADGTRLMDSRDTFSPFSKSTNDEVIFITKNRIE